jgi:hypothetical protein
VVAETNPTPALAMLLPQQDVDALPSRKNPKSIENNVIRAKSDWYWRLGSAHWVARILDDESIGQETNHERIAGLFALALASQLAKDSARAVAALGDSDGIYLVPSAVDETWKADVDRIGIAHGLVAFVRNQFAIADTSRVQTLRVQNVAENVEGPEGEDIVLVVLNDNGGLNVAANQWLEEFSVPCRLEAGELSFTVEAAFQSRSDMFRITPSAKTLAKRLHFDGEHLSKAAPVTFEATITRERRSP